MLADSKSDIKRLATELSGKRVAVLTGAGCSTESGIPDYRGPETRRRARNPIKFQAFAGNPAQRARYWARSSIGWPKLAGAEPNHAHLALSELEQQSKILGVITQNVDSLHSKAGSKRVVELHGRLSEVRCLTCGHIELRDALQERLKALNPGVTLSTDDYAPDGDAELSTPTDYQAPACLTCEGVLKPNVVFFGEGVPKPIVQSAWDMFEEAEVLLVIGTSLTVWSGFRFVKKASQVQKPVYMINLSETRGDPHASLIIREKAGEALVELSKALEQ